MDKMEFDFNSLYGRSIVESIDRRFSYILIASLFFTLSLIAILKTFDYDLNKHNFYLKYASSMADLKTDLNNIHLFDPAMNYEKPKTGTTSGFIVRSDRVHNKKDRELIREKIRKEQEQQGILKVLGASVDAYEDLPDLSVESAMLIDNPVAAKNKYSANIQSLANARLARNGDTKEVVLDETFNPWEYDLKRKGGVFLQTTSAMVNDKEVLRGWRNPDEISVMIQKRQTVIQYCYKKEKLSNGISPGYILVRFRISYKGFVEPGSVEILKSTLYNKKVESCIKKSLGRWHGFDKLSPQMGSVSVLQKFIFN